MTLSKGRVVALAAIAYAAAWQACTDDSTNGPPAWNMLTSDEQQPFVVIAEKMAHGGDPVVSSAQMTREIAVFIDVMFVLTLNVVESVIPASVTDPKVRAAYAQTNYLRRLIKRVASDADALRHNVSALDRADYPEVGANLTLAYRHLEDASMRAGKTLQALDGGVSVYDRSTTVGA